jgi:hypothetical protein
MAGSENVQIILNRKTVIGEIAGAWCAREAWLYWRNHVYRGLVSTANNS